jgi:hypothetical protein
MASNYLMILLSGSGRPASCPLDFRRRNSFGHASVGLRNPFPIQT